MQQIAGFEVYGIDFDRAGKIVKPGELSALTSDLTAALGPATGTTDLLVLSHGWNNDKAEALGLYTELLTSMRTLINQNQANLGPRRLKVLTVYWPSKRFADADLTPGGAASVDADTALTEQLDDLTKLFDGSDEFSSPADPDKRDVIHTLKGLLPQVEDDDRAADEFGRLTRSLFPGSVNEEEQVIASDFYTLDGRELLERLSRPIKPAVLAGGGAAVLQPAGAPGVAAGGTAGLGNLFQGMKNGVRNLLNLFTYYEMKERAGIVGRGGMCEVLLAVQNAAPNIKVHLAGHSFGGRLVTAALAAPRNTLPASSVTLLQAAFSHWGFAQAYDGQKDGLFRGGLASKRLHGPLLITHTSNDKAVGLAYPLASRLARQLASKLGDANDPYGGIGRNGAQRTPEVDPSEATLRAVGSPYKLTPGKICNLEASAFISGHSDVRGLQVAHALLSAITL